MASKTHHQEANDSRSASALHQEINAESIEHEDDTLEPELEAFLRSNNLGQESHLFAQVVKVTDNSQSGSLQLEDTTTNTYKWRQPFAMYLVVIATALGALTQGWSQTSMNGANLYFPEAFGIGSNSRRDKLIVGLTNSGIYLSNGLLGAWLVTPLNLLGRRGAVLTASIVSCLSTLGGAMSQDWVQLLCFRLVLGCSLGIVSSTLNVFAAESVPASIRGALAVSWQMFCAFGIFIGFVANVMVFDYGPSSWRLQLAAPFISTLPLIALIYLCPESPAWLIKHGKPDQAFQSLSRLRVTREQAAHELYVACTRSGSTEQSSFLRSLGQLFTIPRIRRATIASHTVMICQQLCGINIISFYSSSIFVDAGFGHFGALLASVAFGFVNFIGAFPAIWTMDSLGRRSLLLVTLPFMAVSMLIAALSFQIPSDNSAHLWLLASAVYLFCAQYSPGMGPVPAAYSAEVFPLSHREIGMSSAVAMTNIWASALSLTFPSLINWLGSQTSFTIYAVLNLVAFVLVLLFVPETRLKTLDELDEVFAISSRCFVRFQILVYAPWWIQRYVLRLEKLECPQLETDAKYQALEQDYGQ